jgi:tetratricopeptide (TPR) repeat protein
MHPIPWNRLILRPLETIHFPTSLYMTAKLTISLFGPFVVSSEGGKNQLPKGTKTRALIALIAASDTLSRQRTWLQDMLWSDRGPDQRAASLRQALSELRRHWRDFPDILRADRQSVSFDPDQIALDSSKRAAGQIFLEDLKVPDKTFSAWITLQRLQRTRPAVAVPSPVTGTRRVRVLCDGTGDPNAVAIELMVQDRLVVMIGECSGVTVETGKALDAGPDALLCTVQAIRPIRGDGILRLTLETLPGRVALRSASALLSDRPLEADAAPATHQACARIADAVKGMVPTLATNPSVAALAAEAVALMFTFERDHVARTIDLLTEAEGIRPSGEVAGWLTQALNIQYVELHVAVDGLFRERVEHCCRKALSLAPLNSDTLAAVANARVNFDRDFAAGYELARRAVEVNPANPLAWWALSNAELCTGQPGAAFESAMKARFFAQGTRFEFWADFQTSVVAAVLGRTEDATRMGERAAAMTPAFRPPLRYLIALNAMRGDFARARAKIARLAREEADFSVTRMVEDPSYPIGIMRRYGRELTESLRSLAAEA